MSKIDLLKRKEGGQKSTWRAVSIAFLSTGLIVMIMAGLISCQPSTDEERAAADDAAKEKPEATNAIADSLVRSEEIPAQFLENFEIAKNNYFEHPDDPDALIWYGRRTAYLGQYQDAIDIYTTGTQKHPNDARMYRHRGHRYLSLRQYDKAIEDFETAVTLIEGQKDQIEPDGLPNERNIPLTTLHGNIWYHLGLAYYLKNDMENALRAFSKRAVTERYDDNIVSGGHWLYMILRRMGKEEAASAAISKVTADMDIIENTSYYDMCRFYKGLITEEALKPESNRSSANDVYNYGLGNWYLYHQRDTARAKAYYQDLLDNGNEYSFAYLAAESDWERLFAHSSQ